MITINLIPQPIFDRVYHADIDHYVKLSLLSDMCRANTLATVKRAGSGHLGTSLSSMDIVTLIYYKYMNVAELGVDHPGRDIYFSSKGHDVPGHYAVLYAQGILDEQKFLNLRRLGGTHGHPNVETEGIEANSGSLGMGISKAKGIAIAKQLTGRGGRVFVMTGDGELQEGQIFESMQTAAHQKIGNLVAIVDNNKVQSDKPVEQIISLGDLERKFDSFGWHVARVDGHDFMALDRQLHTFLTDAYADRPKIIIADTIKGKGVSFMEHPTALEMGKGLYPWHAGAPDDDSFSRAYAELINRIQNRFKAFRLGDLPLFEIEPPQKGIDSLADLNVLGEPVSQALRPKLVTRVSDEYVVEAFGNALVEQGKSRADLVVIDGDLAADTRLRRFEETYPDRFFENGIAEQDMVSAAGGMARHGLLPVVSSFASFLASRANEQIYNNASEGSKIIYACHYAGLIPAGPGFSHQSIRDISLFGALPNCTILQPCNAAETEMAVDYCVNVAEENCVIRLVIGPSPRLVTLPTNYSFTPGQGVTLLPGNDAILFVHGPVMVHEGLLAGELLAERGFGLRVINMPWLNRLDIDWFKNELSTVQSLYTLEDHAPYGGLGAMLLSTLMSEGLANVTLRQFAVEGYPACGTPTEALKYHQLDGLSVAKRIMTFEDGP